MNIALLPEMSVYDCKDIGDKTMVSKLLINGDVRYTLMAGKTLVSIAQICGIH